MGSHERYHLYLLISGGVIGTSYFLTIGFHNLYVLLILKIGIAVSLYVFIMWIGKSVIFLKVYNLSGKNS